MFKRIALAVILTLATLPVAHADDAFPQAPVTKWWNQRPVPEARYGQWLPCRTEWKISNDCVEGVNLLNKDGGVVGSLTYEPNPTFNPATSKQEWAIVNSPSGPVENSAYFVDLMGSVNKWILPTGITNADGSNAIDVVVHMMQGGNLQTTVLNSQNAKNSIPEGYYYEVLIRSTVFSKNIKWIFSNVRDPKVKLEGSQIRVIGLPDKSPWAGGEPVCETNESRANFTAYNIAINLIGRDYGRTTEVTEPGDVILGTNGWWCLQEFGWDSKLQQIVVKIGNSHYDEFGNVIEGWMELKIKGDRARKWWGMDPAVAAGYAKVELTYQDGTKRIATVASQYDKKNDWINLRAYGFTYSQPKLAISFKKSATAPVKKPATKTTITCVKGKSTKKVTSTNPKCPSGFKVK